MRLLGGGIMHDINREMRSRVAIGSSALALAANRPHQWRGSAGPLGLRGEAACRRVGGA